MVRFLRRPPVSRPILVAAFEGWNDAGEAASYASAYIAQATGAVNFAEIDPEEFFDFTEVRPEVSLSDSDERNITWPTTSISFAPANGVGHDVILLRGPEPQLRWRTYCESIVELAKRCSVERVVLLGAYLSEVTHSRPVPVNATSRDLNLVERYGLATSLYEGPTGIVGVLGASLNDAGIPSAAIWASVPCYSLPVSPKAALALVKASTRLLGRAIELQSLEAESVEYERRMDELVAEDEAVAAYVARVEEMEEVSTSEVSVEGLTDEIERYLRDGRSG
jgi:proteasome assembly chaperone (PAC2) family protein